MSNPKDTVDERAMLEMFDNTVDGIRVLSDQWKFRLYTAEAELESVRVDFQHEVDVNTDLYKSNNVLTEKIQEMQSSIDGLLLSLTLANDNFDRSQKELSALKITRMALEDRIESLNRENKELCRLLENAAIESRKNNNQR